MVTVLSCSLPLLALHLCLHGNRLDAIKPPQAQCLSPFYNNSLTQTLRYSYAHLPSLVGDLRPFSSQALLISSNSSPIFPSDTSLCTTPSSDHPSSSDRLSSLLRFASPSNFHTSAVSVAYIVLKWIHASAGYRAMQPCLCVHGTPTSEKMNSSLIWYVFVGVFWPTSQKPLSYFSILHVVPLAY